MYEKKSTRQIRDQRATIDRVVEERDEARKEAADAVRQNGRLIIKAQDQGAADAREMARLQAVAETWVALAAADKRRSERFGRALVRCWAEIGRLRKTVAARDVSIKALQDRLIDREGGDRAVMLPVPRKDPAATERRELKAHIAKLEAQLHVLQTANENADWRTNRVGAALQKAS